MDLRTGFPRSMRTVLEGHVHLARMIDKCRAVLAGTEGPYIYPCPLDRRLLEFAGLSVEQFTEAVRKHRTDDGVAQWFRRTARRHAAAELDTWNAMMLGLGPSTPEQQTAYHALRGAVDPSRTDLTRLVRFTGSGGRSTRPESPGPARTMKRNGPHRSPRAKPGTRFSASRSMVSP